MDGHTVHVFNALSRVHLQTIGTGCGAAVGLLNRPTGLRITADGAQVGCLGFGLWMAELEDMGACGMVWERVGAYGRIWKDVGFVGGGLWYVGTY